MAHLPDVLVNLYMLLRIAHTTRYTYPFPVCKSHNEVRLYPCEEGRTQQCHDFSLITSPATSLFSYETERGRVHHFAIENAHAFLEITLEATVEVHRENPFAALQWVVPDCHFYDNLPAHPNYPEYYEHLQETARTPHLPECQQIAATLWAQSEGRTASFLLGLTHWIHDNFTYAPGVTHVNTPLSDVLKERKGVCQDFTHLMLAICRHQGIPARYVSGYLYNGRQTNTANLMGADATHAWVECLLPDKNNTASSTAHWCGFDPTNRLLVHNHYVKVHHGCDYDDVSPIRGVYWGSTAKELQVSVQVTKL
jgi:transglutaminase-like putative cysteine protease